MFAKLVVERSQLEDVWREPFGIADFAAEDLQITNRPIEGLQDSGRPSIDFLKLAQLALTYPRPSVLE
jgi:hypothetical protein